MSETQFETDSRRLKERMQQARDMLPEETYTVEQAMERVRMGESTYWKELADQTMSIASLRAALEQFVGCINVTGGVLQYESGNVSGCVGDPEWLDLSDAYMNACKALNVEPVLELADADLDEEYEGGTESLLDLIQKEPPGHLDKLVAASEALVRATTGIRGRDVEAGIIDDDKTFDERA